jgi:hypothetical protein
MPEAVGQTQVALLRIPRVARPGHREVGIEAMGAGHVPEPLADQTVCSFYLNLIILVERTVF